MGGRSVMQQRHINYAALSVATVVLLHEHLIGCRKKRDPSLLF